MGVLGGVRPCTDKHKREKASVPLPAFRSAVVPSRAFFFGLGSQTFPFLRSFPSWSGGMTPSRRAARLLSRLTLIKLTGCSQLFLFPFHAYSRLPTVW